MREAILWAFVALFVLLDCDFMTARSKSNLNYEEATSFPLAMGSVCWKSDAESTQQSGHSCQSADDGESLSRSPVHKNPKAESFSKRNLVVVSIHHLGLFSFFFGWQLQYLRAVEHLFKLFLSNCRPIFSSHQLLWQVHFQLPCLSVREGDFKSQDIGNF